MNMLSSDQRMTPFGTERDHAEMVEIIVSAARHEAVRCAAVFSFADHLAEGPKTALEIAEAEHLHPDATLRLMRACTTFGLLTYDEPSGFSATSLLQTLRRENPASMRDSIISWLGPAYQLTRSRMVDAIRSGSAQAQEALGAPVWQYYSTDLGKEEASSLTQSLRLLTEAFATEAPGLIAVDSGSYVLDVGGGSGKLVLSLLEHNPELRGGVLELKEASKRAEEAARVAGLQDRFTAIEGDFLQDIPGADIYILKSVLHDWPDEQCLTILRNIRASMTETSRLLIAEQVLDETMPLAISAYLDLTMLVAFGGRERTLGEFSALLGSAGLRVTATIQTKSFPYSVIEAKTL